jgi:hypothetical protein
MRPNPTIPISMLSCSLFGFAAKPVVYPAKLLFDLDVCRFDAPTGLPCQIVKPQRILNF